MSVNANNKLTKNSRKRIKGFLSINDLRDKEYNNIELTHNERLAIKNFDRYRIKILAAQHSEKDFHHNYQKLQVLANLSPYDEFLKEEYF